MRTFRTALAVTVLAVLAIAAPTTAQAKTNWGGVSVEKTNWGGVAEQKTNWGG